MRILVVGGAGYIGSVVSHMLVSEGYQVVILDNLVKGHKAAIPAGCEFIQGCMGNRDDLDRALQGKIDAVMHFAALSLVGESVVQPSQYYANNVVRGLALLDAMRDRNIHRFVFSSTAAVYGEPHSYPITEDFPLNPTNPYGESKLAFEKILKWYSAAYDLKYVSLRYFNAAGATSHVGEDHDPETHLIPLVLKTANRQRASITIFGDDYDTPDGTCIRDYIHVLDLARAHVMALEHLANTSTNNIFNLGNGTGVSVKEIIAAAESVTGLLIPKEIGPRRAGDPAVLVASNEKIQQTLGWTPKHSSIEEIIEDAWRWLSAHPQGYGPKSNMLFLNQRSSIHRIQ